MKRLILFLALVVFSLVLLAMGIGAKDVYLEEIPNELKNANDPFTHFVVFEEEKYYTGSGSTINGFNTNVMNEDMASCGIDSSLIGTKYLTRFNVPSHLNGTLITYVNLNSMKSHTYFWGKCGYVQLCGTVNQIHDMNQATGQLRCIDFGENSEITKIPEYLAANSQNLLSVKNFPRNLDEIGGNAFNKCHRAFTGELYLNATVIKSSSFNNAFSHLTGLVLGPRTSVIENQSLCVRLEEIALDQKPADNTLQLKYIEFECDVSKVNFAKQGNNLGVFYFIGTSRSPYSKMTEIVLSHPDNVKNIKEGSVFNDFLAEGVVVLFNDANGLDDYVTASHSYREGGIAYDSFFENGLNVTECSLCGKKIGEDVPSIFTCLGYSVSTYENSFTVGYRVNFDALAAYEKSSGFTISYGILAVAENNLKGNTPLDENGNATVLQSGSVLVGAIVPVHSYFNGKVIGIETDALKDTQIILTAYAVAKDENKAVMLVHYGSLDGVCFNELSKQ